MAGMADGGGTALLVVDVQKGLFERAQPIYEAGRLLENICVLAGRAHRSGVPVFYVQHANKSLLVPGSEAWQLHPRLRPLDTDVVLHKRHGSAFQETDLAERLSACAVGHIVVAGLVTHGCVQVTCKDGQQRGYQVTLVTDAHSNFHRQPAQVITQWHAKLLDRGVRLQPTAEIDFSR